jgi:hypothetical protein
MLLISIIIASAARNLVTLQAIHEPASLQAGDLFAFDEISQLLGRRFG